MKKPKRGSVGITRHPEIYLREYYDPIVTDVDKEIEMWDVAEQIFEIMKSHKFSIEQIGAINHYVLALLGYDDGEEYAMLAYLQYRILLSKNKQLFQQIYGNSARQTALKILKEKHPKVYQE